MLLEKLGLVVLVSSVALLAGCGSDSVEEVEGSVDSALAGSSANDRVAFEFFVGKGLSAIQSAALVGNMDQESGMDPRKSQPGGAGRGIVQWTASDRWVREGTFAQSEGLDRFSLQAQLDFAWHELTTISGYHLSSLRRATTIASAVQIIEGGFEACGNCQEARRIQYANTALRSFGGASVTATSAPAKQEEPAGDCMVDGAMGTCIDTSDCSGTATPGLCPGAANIQCCVQ